MGCIFSGPTELHLAAETGNLDVVRGLVKKDAPYYEYDQINRQDGQGRTALFLAASVGKIEVIKELIANPNIDVNLKDENGDTAQIIAGLNKHPECVDLLLSAPGAFNRKKKSGAADSLQAFAGVSVGGN